MIVALQTLVYFRQSLFSVLEKLLLPYYEKFASSFGRLGSDGDEDDDDQVYAEFDDEKGVVFFPPMYLQRYAAVSDCLMDERWCGQLEKVVDLGHHDMSFIKYLKEVPGVRCIIGVDIESIPLRCSSDLLGCEDYAPKRESPLKVTLFQGNAADPDYRLIGTDAVVAIEMIEHMLPHDLDRMVHTVFGFVKPWVAVFTTPNADFNALFKSMEKNGLRRWDHFFEWTREQFHDWCSNIVTRYPQYTVTCKGIGPGPAGTLHYGCCSQLALFVNKDYQKQQELNPNSLALVATAPSDNTIKDMMTGWESPNDQNNVALYSSGTSLSDGMFSAKESCVRMLVASSTFSIETLIEYADKTSQCNLDIEIGRNFLMFNEEDMCLSILVPRRNIYNRVYEIEDVNCRLNCSTYQVKKFSQTAQNLMAKYKQDSLIHTREVVSEIRHLTNMLNFDSDSEIHGQNGKHVWHNFNWGENAPYWNQYYKIVREFNYPFETKSEESRIIDLITEEINKLTEIPYEDECSVDMNKVEIPIQHLMKIVSHITHDVEKVKDLLEWNGYEVVGNMVIHSRLVVGNASVTTDAEEWPENDTVTDWDTSDAMSFSEASTIVPDCNVLLNTVKFLLQGRALRHALDAKVRKLRAMVSTDEDITTELDKVVCRLMKLALRTCKSRTCVPPSKWMQFKLLDLLTLTEKTIERRKRHCVQGLKAIGFVSDDSKCIENAPLSKFKNDNTAAEILDKYKNIMSFSDIDISREQFLDSTIERKYIEEKKMIINDEIKLERTQAWVEEKNVVHIVNYPFQKETLETSQAIVNYPFPNESLKTSEAKQRFFENEIRRSSKKKPKLGDKKRSETKLKKVLPTKSSSNSFVKRYKRCLASHERRRYDLKSQKRIKDHQILQSKASNPIPGSIIELCHPELRSQKNIEYPFNDKIGMNMESDKDCNIAATEESLLVDIVMDDTEETIALRRTIGTDAEISSICREQEAILNSVINATTVHQADNVQPAIEQFDSQNIFIFDINEPSTSKGVRHVSMDVQCGTDPIPPSHAMPSPASSLTKMPEIFTSGIKIEDSKTNFLKMDDVDTPPKSLTRAKSPSVFSKGIKIGDSTTNVPLKKNSSNFGASVSEEELPGLLHSNAKGIKIEDSLTNMRKKRSLDFDCLKNSEKSPPKKSELIHCYDNVFDFKKPKMNEMDFGTRTDSKTGTPNTAESCAEQCKAGIPNLKSLKFFPEVKDTESSDIKTHEIKFDYKTFIDVNYIGKTTPNKSCSFSTSTEDIETHCKSAPPIRYPSVGVKIKDSDANVHSKVDCQTETLDDLLAMPVPSPPPLKCTFAMETKLIKPIGSSSKMEDSCSELNESCVSVKSPSLCPNYVSEEERNLSPTKHLNLSRGGIHVHSYREKQVSEDVMYQGEWQRHKPRTNARKAANKKAIDSALRRRRVSSKEKIQSRKVETKKLTEPVLRKRRPNSKERVPGKRPDQKKFDSKVEQKPVQVRRPKVEKPKENNLKKTEPTKKNFLRRDATKKSVQPRGISKVASKIAVSSISSKTKNTLVVKRASAMVSTVVNKDDNKKEKRLKNYIPRYLLRRKIREAQQSNLSDSVKINKSQTILELREIQKQLTDFNPDALNSTSYVVFRNEIEGINNTGTNNQADSVKETITRNKERNNIRKRTGSPASQNSSTCSTSDSIATIKAVTTRSKVCTKKHSTPSSRSAINSESDSNNTPDKNKKGAKKPATNKEDENKENIPESSDTLISLKNIKSAFMGRNKSVFMALKSAESATKQKEQGFRKSNIKIPVVGEKKEKKICDGPTIMKSSSYSLEGEEHQMQEDVSNYSQIADILDQSFELGSIPHLEYSADSTVLHEISNNTVSTEWYDSSRNSVSSTESSVQTAMRRIVEDSLQLALRTPTFTEVPNTDTLCCEHCHHNFEATLSPISYKTTTQENFNSTLVNELENALSKSFDFDTATDGASTVSFAQSFISDNTDIFSFKSSSEYYLADETISDNDPKPSNAEIYYLKEKTEPVKKDDSIVNKVNSVSHTVDSAIEVVDSVVDDLEPSATNVGIVGVKEESVHGIYERKEPLMMENPGGSLAIQAFSGFSMNTNRLSGDQPDYVNLIDSETGSYAVGINRQATSEEVFVSGRSSESFQSCLVDEDAVVPNWLFNLMQQQQSINIPVQEEDEELILPMAVPMPIAEPVFDLNGNATEATIGVGAGAGDGRGIHSDNSQDSSGRGTSMSSSESSSGAHSEAILIDPSAFTAQFELLQESVASSTAVTAIVLPSSTESLNPLQRIEDSSNEAVTTSSVRNDTASSRRNGRGYHTSDVDADVSSIDDLPDSSDN